MDQATPCSRWRGTALEPIGGKTRRVVEHRALEGIKKEISMRSLILSVVGVCGLFIGLLTSNVGCDSVDAAFDCQAVCSRYHDCYDGTYDVGACRDRCRAASASDSSYRSKADQCQACIGDRSCLSATFACGTTCGAIVPGP